MELIVLWNVVKRRWWLIALPTAIAFGLALAKPAPEAAPGFTATVHVTAAQSPGASEMSGGLYEDSAYYPWIASEHLIDALTDWVKTTSFSVEVSRVLAGRGIEIEPEAMYGIFIADNSHSIMRLITTWHDAGQLEQIVDAAIEVLAERNQDYFPQLSTEPASVIPLDEIVIAPQPPPVTSRLSVILKGGVGFAAGVGLAFLADYLDRTIRNKQEIESLGFRVIGEIPRR